MTMARAFQRTSERMRRSMNRSPGMRASWVTGMVLRYGRGDRVGQLGTTAGGQLAHAGHQVVGAVFAFAIEDGFEGVEPFLGFDGIEGSVRLAPGRKGFQNRLPDIDGRACGRPQRILCLSGRGCCGPARTGVSRLRL